MAFREPIRLAFASCTAVCMLWAGAAAAQSEASTAKPVVLDRVVAVVNNRAVLASDVDNEMRLSILEPRTNNEKPDPKSALQRLIGRTLIQQQIRREEEEASVPTEENVEARIEEMRHQLPACMRANCETDAGWAAFLSENHLKLEDVENYYRRRLEILSFIENRFRQGIRISEEEIQTYYNSTLLPQYPAGIVAPSLESVSKRIEEILLQQHVNVLFSAWLDNLRKQGDVEVLDPALETPRDQASQGGGSA